MREIKFRAWDKKLKMWHEWGLDIKPGVGAYFIGPPHSELIHCQFTGLHDKNGKEIYEGDVVRAVSRNHPRQEVIGEVTYDDGEYQVETDDDYWPVASVVVLENFEVIGNIHDNPSLLESTHD